MLCFLHYLRDTNMLRLIFKCDQPVPTQEMKIPNVIGVKEFHFPSPTKKFNMSPFYLVMVNTRNIYGDP